MNCRAYAERDSTYRRCPSAKIVSNANDDLPEPERPVNTIIVFRGIETVMSLRLCVRAPLTIRRSSLVRSFLACVFFFITRSDPCFFWGFAWSEYSTGIDSSTGKKEIEKGPAMRRRGPRNQGNRNYFFLPVFGRPVPRTSAPRTTFTLAAARLWDDPPREPFAAIR